MTTLTFHKPAQDGERFAPDAFASSIGSRVPITADGHALGDCLIVDAAVAEDGSAVTLTLDVPDEAVPPAPIGCYSLGLPR